MLDQTDPLASAQERMQSMDKDELIKLVLIAANRVGIATNGDSVDPLEATSTFIQGINTVFTAYDTAMFEKMHGHITWGGFGNVAQC